MDIKTHFEELYDACKIKHLKITVLGYVDDDPILFISNEYIHPTKPSVLIAAGFHGDEIAGPLAILQYIKHTPQVTFNLINISFLPAVCPSGMSMNGRYNKYNESPNSGWIHEENTNLSKEGAVLMDHMPLILRSAKDGFITLHEDNWSRFTYIYSFENTDKPTKFSTTIFDSLNKYFLSLPTGESTRDGIERGSCIDGIIFNYHDGTFEDFLSHHNIKTICTETPGHADLELRISANVDVIDDLVLYSLTHSMY